MVLTYPIKEVILLQLVVGEEGGGWVKQKHAQVPKAKNKGNVKYCQRKTEMLNESLTPL